ncbi:hypothetical protein ACLK11_21360 [Escherichia coli]
MFVPERDASVTSPQISGINALFPISKPAEYGVNMPAQFPFAIPSIQWGFERGTPCYPQRCWFRFASIFASCNHFINRNRFTVWASVPGGAGL